MESNRHHSIFWGSSYDRGLDTLLYMWPEIVQKFPDAQLHICYGWDLFDKANHNNPERMAWKKSVEVLMGQKGIHHHGRVGQDKLKEIRSSCGIWAYPTWFAEINCITALEAQNDGLVPVTMNSFALKETVGSGIKVEGEIADPKVQQTYLDELLAIMGDQKRWQEESGKAKSFAKDYYWDKIASKWLDVIKEPVSEPKVSVVTITIREGFWNIMASNLAKQTYKNFEWIIVDDYKKTRYKTAQKYAKKYGLNIRYIHGDKARGLYTRRYGLVRANNTGWNSADGELLIFLQDFILIPENGIESIVDIYRHNPDALIAPVDEYYHCKLPDMKNKEDWWNGDTDIITKFSWRNVRVEFKGIRQTENPFDFEMNYGAIPMSIIKKLGGWWEFFDDALGFDNTEIAHRALEAGYRVIIDDTNIATCVDLWPHIGGTAQNIVARDRYLSMPHWVWLKNQMLRGNLTPFRDAELDNAITLKFEVPKEIPDEKCSDWLREHAVEIAEKWGDVAK